MKSRYFPSELWSLGLNSLKSQKVQFSQNWLLFSNYTQILTFVCTMFSKEVLTWIFERYTHWDLYGSANCCTRAATAKPTKQAIWNMKAIILPALDLASGLTTFWAYKNAELLAAPPCNQNTDMYNTTAKSLLNDVRAIYQKVNGRIISLKMVIACMWFAVVKFSQSYGMSRPTISDTILAKNITCRSWNYMLVPLHDASCH